MLRSLLTYISLVGVVSCGKHNFPDYNGNGDAIQHRETAKVFVTRFLPLNQSDNKFHGFLRTSKIQFYASIAMDKGPAKTLFKQFIHEGPMCPGPEDDLNGDNRLDITEVVLTSGRILIPLDGRLNEQEDGGRGFPRSNDEGTYFYSGAASINLLYEDLYKPDRDPEDITGNLQPGERLDLSRRTIIIYGSKEEPLLPVACAEIN